MSLLLPPVYQFDPTGKLLANKVTGEQQILTTMNFRDYHFIVPMLGPYFAESLKVTFRSIDNQVSILNEGIDYYCTHPFISASRACAAPIYGSISFLNLQLAGVITLEYQSLGGIWLINENKIAEILADRLHNPRITAWDVVTDMPISFPPIDHAWDLVDLVGAKEIVAKLSDINTTLLNKISATLPAPVSSSNGSACSYLEIDVTNYTIYRATPAEAANKIIRLIGNPVGTFTLILPTFQFCIIIENYMDSALGVSSPSPMHVAIDANELDVVQIGILNGRMMLTCDGISIYESLKAGYFPS